MNNKIEILKTPRIALAEATARRVLHELGIASLPIDPIRIAEEHSIMVEAKSTQNEGFSGMLARVGETFGIMYATHLENEGFERFSIAHELGHYFLPDHVQQVLREGVHRSHANFSSGDPYEQEADAFAAALLTPEPLFRTAMSRYGVGLAVIQSLAKDCKTSLTATACRFARFTPNAAAIIQSTDGIIDFCTFSETMKDAKVRWLKKGTPVPAGTLTARLARNSKAVLEAAEMADEVDLCDWFDCSSNHIVKEEVVGQGRYGKVLTIIWSERLSRVSDPGYDEVDEEEEERQLIESYTPRFRR
jgi:Zn-dependent peptidase ImmA (M78 family)